jgi:hypothetical protein
MKNPESQRLALAAGGALLVAGAMLAHGNRLGFVSLALAAACAIGAFARARRG